MEIFLMFVTHILVVGARLCAGTARLRSLLGVILLLVCNNVFVGDTQGLSLPTSSTTCGVRFDGTM